MCDKQPIRIILTEDGGQLMNWPVPPTQKIVEDFVAGYAGQGVDVLSYGLQGGHLAVYDSNVLNRQHIDLPHDDSLEGKNLRHMAETGLDYPAIIADATHRHGMQFWPTARMNNTGGCRSLTHEKHPDWFFAGYANMYGFSGGYRPMMDYERAAIRRASAMVPASDLTGLIVGELCAHADTSIQRIRRALRDPAATVATRAAAEHRTFQIRRDLVRALDRLGYLPSAAKEIQSTIDRKASRQAHPVGCRPIYVVIRIKLESCSLGQKTP